MTSQGILDGKVALVTGGSRGIGAATAVRLAREGADVAVGHVNGKEAAEGLDTLSLADVDRVLDVNVRGVFLASQAAAAWLPEGGRIITIGSCMARRVPGPGGTLYATSKAALAGLTKALARELGGRGITANLVLPGPIDTDMNPADGPYAAGQAAMTALGRFGTAEEVASTVAYLAGATYVTGAEFSVDGGHAA
ncbi:SDR family oxidoreductase [Streptomyces sp. NRRL S-146]|uniref:SDR family oxidoreductase n=1 Tax=Streptomyces sp. NRRL S-146 TaxID=1463884 RepID=UPI0004CAC8E8|nr:SDR family oxidoreductase [Streptomyces sp. NRRL S-146]